jgi:hypothetical protein
MSDNATPSVISGSRPMRRSREKKVLCNSPSIGNHYSALASWTYPPSSGSNACADSGAATLMIYTLQRQLRINSVRSKAKC